MVAAIVLLSLYSEILPAVNLSREQFEDLKSKIEHLKEEEDWLPSVDGDDRGPQVLDYV